ncbi:MFS transporter [Auritidibacter sp. NML100628]|uniref:MFS transporter n=1 Tax=Auritidibacter sp. NML100628 TaxID=2170742 RepID=UPI000D72C4BA|nr:MFS transporter [Auritidibacter sp. NML100628]PXA76711.1 MFS transporter [Auritidibacter sp. NML100628]
MTTTTTLPKEPSPTQPTQAAPKKSLIASTSGQLLEWYEWSAYAVFAPFIAGAMFDDSDPVSALLATLAVFAVGFLVRPLGGILFGAMADRKGRKAVLIMTMLTMATASVLIGVLPTYETIGVWASAGLLLLRIAQGLAHGGESAAANSYVAEIAPAHKRGQWSSLVFVTIFGGSVLAYSVGGGISAVVDETALAAWGWRIPFVLGAILAVVALLLRRNMAESAVHEQAHHETDETPVAPAQASAPTTMQLTPRKFSQTKAILLIIGMVSGATAAHYTWSSYVSTYAIVEQSMEPTLAYTASVGAQLIALFSLPFWGRLSDRIGRRPIMATFAVLMIITQIPLKSMISDNPWSLFIAATIALLIVGAAGALLSCMMSEVFPTKFRTRNIGLAYSISVAVFGGSAPYLNQLFISIDMSWLSSFYIIVLCVVTLFAVRLLPETRGIDLNKV